MKIEKGCFIVMRKAGSSISKTTNDTNDVYYWVSLNFDEKEAIEASSWCELAVVGDVYFGDGFTIGIFLD